MRLRILLIVFVSMAVAREGKVERFPRTPQAQIKYQDPNGLKVNWKFFTPRSHYHSQGHSWQEQPAESQQSQLSQSQPQSRLVQINTDHLLHRSYPHHQIQPEPEIMSGQMHYKAYMKQQMAEPEEAPEVQVSTEKQTEPNQINYEKYMEDQSSSKQVPQEKYESQHQSYPDSSNAEMAGQEEPAEMYGQSEEQKSGQNSAEPEEQGRIIYKEEYEQLQQQKQQNSQIEHIPVPVERLPPQPPQKLILDKDMPTEIKELLKYQARIPYDVIANSITYKPKTLFVPKPFPSEYTGSYHYPSKIYYVNNEYYRHDYEETKPVEEEQWR